jgi:hypothetical protein
MAHRGRSQAVLAQRWSSAGMVGAVGKASVGFGLAVGRSRSIRPTVLFDDVNSAALRPSLDLWRMRRDVSTEAEADDTAPVTWTSESVTATDAVVRRSAAAPSHARAPGSPASAGSAARRRGWSQQAQRSRPTWTDQVIARSAIGYNAPPSQTRSVEPERPADFVPTGDEKLDRLRLLVQQKADSGRPATGTRADSNRSAAPTAGVPAAAAGDERDVTARPRHAGIVPGGLARSMRPESAAVAAAPGSSPRLGSATPTPGSSARPRRARQAEPTKQERLKQLLVERGLIDDDSAPAAAGADGPRDGDATAGSSRERSSGASPRRPAISDRDVRRSPASPAHRGPQASPTNSANTDAGRRPAPGSVPPAGDRAAPGRSDGPRAAAPSSPQSGVVPQPGSQASAQAPSRSQADTDPASRSLPGTDPSSGLHARNDAAARSSVALADRTVERAAASSQMRLRRLLRSDRTDHDGESLDDAVDERALDRSDVPDAGDHAMPAPALRGTSGSPAVRDGDAARHAASPATAAAATAAAHTTTVAPPTARHRIRAARTPALPGDLLARRPGDVRFRRLSLPRATSASHRPASVLPSPVRSASSPPVVAGTGAGLAGTAAAVAGGASTAVGGSAHAVAAAEAPVAVSGGERELAGRSSASVGRTEAAPMGPGPVRAVSAASGDARSELATSRPSPSAPTSTMSASAAAVLRRAATGRDASDGRSSTATPRPTNRSIVAPGTGTLADVVRRNIIVHHSAAPSSPSAPVGVATPNPASTGAANTAGESARSEAGPGDARAASTPAEVVAAKFMTELSATVRRRPAPLPTPFRPMADAIAGRRPVMLSTDDASRRALRSVRKVAATTDNTIHLDPTAIPRARLDEVVAHELTHIAHPSPTPRFFDDIDDSPEERRAEQVARVMARSPLAPSATTSAPPARRRRDDATIRRSPAAPRTATSQGSSSGTVSAQALAASLTRTSSPGTSDVVQRWDRASPSPSARSSSSSTSSSSRPQIGSHRSASNEPPDTKSDASSGRSSYGSSGGASSPFGSEREAAEWFDKRLAANVGPLVRMIEDRMRIELERRGGRNWRRS